MELVSALAAGKSLLELAQEIAKVVEKAQNSQDVKIRVLLYLETARAAVNALGLERQHILSDVRQCSVTDPQQVEALCWRLDQYLHVDNIRPQLELSLKGLGACRKVIEREANAAWWRKRDKQAAVQAFLSTLSELESVLQNLTYNFFPGYSGMGVQTLEPIFNFVKELHDNFKLNRPNIALDVADEELAELALLALRDNSHEQWFRNNGKIEALITELQLAFSVKSNKVISDIS